MGNDISLCQENDGGGCTLEVGPSYCSEQHEDFEIDYALFKAPVFLNVYHLDENWPAANKISTNVLGFGGAYHVGVQVFNIEYFFSVAGLVSDYTPRTSEKHVYYKSVFMGETKLSAQQVREVIKRHRRSWRAENYDLLRNNCCNYAEVLCQELVGLSLPSWVSNLPRIASAAADTIEGAVDMSQKFSTPERPTSRKRRRAEPQAEFLVASIGKSGIQLGRFGQRVISL